MSDKEKKKEEISDKAKGWARWADTGMSDISSGLMAALFYSATKEHQYKMALDLAPGDIIQVAHVQIFVVGVQHQEYCPPTQDETNITIKVAGAECTYTQNDWQWKANEITYDSPFLRFFPEAQILLIRKSPTKTSTLDRLLSIREEAKKKMKAKMKDFGTHDWDGVPGYESKIEDEDPPAEPPEEPNES